MLGTGGLRFTFNSATESFLNRWLLAVIFDWSLILLCFAAAGRSFWLWPIGLLVIATRQHALGILGHEAAHQRGRMNDAVANWLCFWPLGVSIERYRVFHFAHHRHLNHPTLDPEQIHRLEMSRSQWMTPCSRSKRARLFVRDFLGLGTIETLKAMGFIGDPLAAVLLVIAFVVFVAFYPVGLLWHYSLIGGPLWAIFRCRIWTEHVGSEDGTYPTVRPVWWRRAIYLPHHTWKHAEHHDRPGVPLYQLTPVAGEI